MNRETIKAEKKFQLFWSRVKRLHLKVYEPGFCEYSFNDRKFMADHFNYGFSVGQTVYGFLGQFAHKIKTGKDRVSA